MGNATATAANAVLGGADLAAAVELDLNMNRLQARAKQASEVVEKKAGEIRAHLKKR